MTARQARAASGFIDTIGVGLHLSYYDTSYGDFAHVQSALDYLGVRHARDGISPSDPEMLRRVDALAADGVKFDWVVGLWGPPVADQERAIAARAAITETVEGPNETDINPITWNGKTGLEGTRAFMADLYAWAHSNAALNANGVGVIQASVAMDFNKGFFGDMGAWADYGNTHSYIGLGQSPSVGALDMWIGHAQATTPGKPVIATEAGYPSSPGIHPGEFEGVSETVQAKLETRLLLEAYSRGIERTYLYELLDELPDPANTTMQQHFGLFRPDGTPKPAATAIHNLTDLLGDPGGTTPPGSLNYTLTGMPAAGHDLLLQKADGSFMLLLWNDADTWNETTHSAISVPDVKVGFDLGQGFSSAKVYDILTGTTAVQSFAAGAKHLDIMVPDHPIIVELMGASSTPIPPPTAPVSLSTGAGPDSLVLKISQDAYQGSAQYTVSVDNKQIGGSFTASAAHAAGQSDTLTLKGDWAAGTHTVSVAFLNDKWNGTAATDRNLYLDAATYNGAAISGAAKALMSSGTSGFSFVEAASLPLPGAGGKTMQGTGAGEALVATNKDDVIVGGRGDDTLTGFLGKDSFAFAQGDGHDMVRDFVSGTDKLVFQGIDSASVTFAKTTHGGLAGYDVHYGAGGDMIFLIKAAGLAASDMLFL